MSGKRGVVVVLCGLSLFPQASAPRYAVEMLACAAFREEIRSDIRSQTGGILRQETAGRDGVLVLRGAPARGEIALTAWYDSLSVWRQSPEGRLTPDTDGLLGGRWRGRLSGQGRFAVDVVPFLPDEVAELADLTGALDDFLPSLPTTALRPGETATLGTGGIIRRIADGSSGVHRYGWTIRPVTDTAALELDTISIPLRRKVEEEGTLDWDPVRGPLRWERRLTLSARLDPRGPIRRGINSVIIQRIRVERLPSQDRCPGGGFGPDPK